MAIVVSMASNGADRGEDISAMGDGTAEERAE
jgi:hypothetical protein